MSGLLSLPEAGRLINKAAFQAISIVGLVFSICLAMKMESSASNSQNQSIDRAAAHSNFAIVTIPSNRAISVNGLKVFDGTTIFSGATISTLDEVSARAIIGTLGSVDISPNTTLTISFNDQNSIYVSLKQGCLVMRAAKMLNGEIATPAAVAAKITPGEGLPLHVCFPDRPWPQQTIRDDSDTSLFHLGRAAAFGVITGRLGTDNEISLRDVRGSNPGPMAP